ncbi:MAG: SprT-like domain-containing protein [Gemmatimonadota bacterium]|nr:SprT-like domain-containing protein [Gemmatimonadota bacterium]
MRAAGKRGSGEAGKHTVFESRLVLLGSRHTALVTHTNRSVMLSLTRNGVLRLHRGYASAPDRVLRAIVRFLNPRIPRLLRRLAEREFLAFPVHEYAPSRPRAERRERARPGDVALLHRLETLHRALNLQHFGGTLSEIPIRLSSRMRRRLGELAVDVKTGRPLEIGLSRRHLARHPWAEVEHTMLHEMVHQWQAETGSRVDHGATFRRRAREVGVLAHAKRTIGGAGGQRVSG